MILLDKKHRKYLKDQMQNDSILIGTPIYKSLNACVLASIVGYNNNYRSAYKKDNENYLVFLNGVSFEFKIKK